MRKRLRLWLFPKLEVSTAVINISLDGYEEMVKQLETLEQCLIQIGAQADVAADAMVRLEKAREVVEARL